MNDEVDSFVSTEFFAHKLENQTGYPVFFFSLGCEAHFFDLIVSDLVSAKVTNLFQMVLAIQVFRVHLLELEKVSILGYCRRNFVFVISVAQSKFFYCRQKIIQYRSMSCAPVSLSDISKLWKVKGVIWSYSEVAKAIITVKTVSRV